MTLAPLSLSTNFNVKFSLAQAFTPGQKPQVHKAPFNGAFETNSLFIPSRKRLGYEKARLTVA